MNNTINLGSKGSPNRNFFDDFAHVINIDPLIPDNWYNVSVHQVSQAKV